MTAYLLVLKIYVTCQRRYFNTSVPNLTIMGPCIVNVFLSTTNEMQRYTIVFIVVSALHVSSGFSAHHQELKNWTYSIGYMSNLFAATANVDALELSSTLSSNPAEVVGFFGCKNPQRAFLRRGSKASVPCPSFAACKRT